MKFLNNYKEHSYTLMRIVTGYLFLWHGTQKFFDFPREWPWGDLSLLQTVGGGIEVIGGILILVGLFTRPAAFICAGQMAVAYWFFHAPGSNPVFPILNGGDLSVLFTFVFLYISCRGAGKWSIDSARSWQ